MPQPTAARAWSEPSEPGFRLHPAESLLAAASAQLPAVAGSPGFESIEGVRVLVASDVDNPLLGPRGAAAVFGAKEPVPLNSAFWRTGSPGGRVVTEAVGRDFADHPGAGAAGGPGFAALALLGAELRPGIELILEPAALRRGRGGC